jgi:putative DNA primase/helicase
MQNRTFTDVVQHAKGVARALGGVVAGRDMVLMPGPNHSPRDRSLAVKIDASAPDGFLTFSFAGDDWKICRDHVRTRLGLPDWQPGDEQRRTIPVPRIDQWDLAAITAEANEGPRQRTEDEAVRIAMARAIWDEAKDPRDTLAAKYLGEHRKLDLPDELAGSVLRFHPACPWRNENTGKIIRVPALVAPFRSIDGDTVTAVHRIALHPDGSKIDRRMLGVVFRTAIKLVAASETLAIAEGLETAMAARQLGFKPVWALGSVGAISFFPIIERVRRLIILGESGEPSARAVKICTTRYRKAHRKVRLVLPQNSAYSDVNDILINRAAP